MVSRWPGGVGSCSARSLCEPRTKAPTRGISADAGVIPLALCYERVNMQSVLLPNASILPSATSPWTKASLDTSRHREAR